MHDNTTRRRRVLVTGASGFVGCHLVAHLAACGDEVTSSEAEITDPEALEADFTGCRPDAVYHLAAQADVKASFTAAAATLRVNVEGTFNVLDAARRAGAGRVVVVSSADVYGTLDPDELPVGEAAPMRPVTPYGASKAAAEMVCVQAGAGRGLDVVRARAFNHLGPGQSGRFVAAALAARIARNERTGAETVPVGNLNARRDFTDVRDVVRAYRLLAEHGACGEAYNVCSGTSLGVRELADALIRQDHAEVQRLVRETMTSMGVSEDQLRALAQRLAEAGGLDPRVAQELSRAFGFEDDALEMEAEPADDPSDDEGAALDPKIMQQLEDLLADSDIQSDGPQSDPEAQDDDSDEPAKGPTT